MNETVVKISDLRPGFIIGEDVFVNTNNPILRKDTVVSLNHLEVLHIFGVKKVKIHERPIVKREELPVIDKVNPIDADKILSAIPKTQVDLLVQYNEATQNYKKEFLGWRVGTKPDITKVRSIVIPLIEVFTEEKRMLALLNDLSNFEDYMFHHSIAVGILAASISRKMGLPNGQVLQLGLAGVLADCGMAKIEPSITEKAAFLTKEEFNEVKKHTVYSYQIIQDTPLLRQEMKVAILQHHERLDGSGYPRGDKTDQVSILSQIIAVADVFHAMTSERIHRAKESPFKVIELIKEEEFGKFDIKVVQALLSLVGDLSIGDRVQLTNGEIGEVVFVHRDASLRPTIKMSTNGEILDLTTNRQIAIDKVLM